MKYLNFKNILLLGAMLALIIFIPQLSAELSNNPSQEEISDMRARTAIYQAITSTIPTSTPSIHRTSTSTYRVPVTESFAPELLETALVNKFEEHSLNVNIELGLFNVEDDSLIYGKNINYGALFSPTKNRVNVQNGSLVIHISRGQGEMLSKSTYLVWLIIGLLLIGSLVYFKREPITDYYRKFLIPMLSKQQRINAQQETAVQQVGNFTFDEKSLLLIHPSGKRQLTYKEGKLLAYFFDQPNTLLERKQILEHVWEEDGFFVARSMDVFISKLRKYLSLEADIKIDNVRGVGYMLKCA